MSYCTKSDKLNKLRNSFIENVLPSLLGVIIAGLTVYLDIYKTVTPNIIADFIPIVITSTSVIIGFMGVAVSIIAMVNKDSKAGTLLRLKDGLYKEKLKKYYMASFDCGGILIGLSVLVMFRSIILGDLIKHVVYLIWGFFIGFTFGSFFRVYKISVNIAFNNDIKEPKQKLYSAKEYEAVQKKCSK